VLGLLGSGIATSSVLFTEISFPAAQTIGVAAIEVPSIATLITAAIARFFHTVCTIIDIILSLLFFASH
jgi:hypothetical protein